MPSADEAWAVVAGPLDHLRTDVLERPELPWQERREVLHQELSSVADGSLVEQLITWLDELPDEHRAALLGSDELAAHAYQVVTNAVAVPAQESNGYDESAWFAYLAENGARWDGTGESWTPFREWFLYYATESGLQVPATLMMDHLEPMAAADRVTLLAQYGVTIQLPEPTGAALDPRAQQAMDELLAAHPEYADIPEARRIELVTELLSEENS